MNTFEIMAFLFLFVVILVLVLLLIKKNKRGSEKQENNKTYNNFYTKSSIEQVVTEQSATINNGMKAMISSPVIDITGIELSPEQKAVYEKLESSNENFFITGKAGTGKSVLLQYFAKNTKKQVAVVAPTGVAALIVGGQTIHSFFSLNIDLQDTSDFEEVSKLPNSKAEVLRHLDSLIIDEVSMVSADVMDMIDAKLQYARANQSPFGGCQIIAFGDLYQLPPVVDNGQVYRFLDDKYKSRFFFGAPGTKNKPLNIVELQEVFRQKDDYFIKLLNRIRVGNVDELLLEDINSRCVLPPQGENIITLTADNATARKINKYNLDSLSSQEYVYEGKIEGDILQSSLPTDLQLHLKVGALVMMLKNDNTDNSSHDKNKKARWVNGTFGIITYLSKDEVRVTINGVEHSIGKASWEKYQYRYDAIEKKIEKEIVAVFVQYPIKIAYAITIHKSQGQTYDKVKIDLNNGAFEDGQVYVALSRCKSIANVYLAKRMTIGDFKVNPEVLNFFSEKKIIQAKENTELYSLYFTEQRSDEWFDLRKNKITGSIAYKLRTTCIDDCLLNLEDDSANEYNSFAMQRGRDLEKVGISLFVNQFKLAVVNIGFIQSNIYPKAGYSPDGVVFGEDGRIKTIIEHKAFFENRHRKNIEKIENKVLYQIQFGMFVSGARDAYLILYNPDMEEKDLQLCIKHVDRDEYIQKLFKYRFEKDDEKIECMNTAIRKQSEERRKEKERIRRKEKSLNRQRLPRKPKSLIKQYSLDGVLVNEYETIAKAAEGGGVSPTSITKCLYGTRKTSGGYIWVRKNIE